MRTRMLLLALAALAGCRTLPKTPQSALDALKDKPGAYLSGVPAGLGELTVLNREDFVWDARLLPDASAVAYSRLGMKSYHLTITPVADPKARPVDIAINPLEFDVEMLDVHPDGSAVATVSKDGALRVYAAKDGALLGSWLGEDALVSVAFSTDGKLVAVGNVKGVVTVLAWPGLAYVSEGRRHEDQVRALAWAPDGRLFSGSWDQKLLVWKLEPGQDCTNETRVRFELKNGLLLFRGALDGRASVAVTPDERLEPLVVRGALAQAAGLDPSALTETVTLQTANGAQVVKVAHGRALTFKGLQLDGLDVAVCDACVPQGAQAVLGQQVLSRLQVARDEAAKEVVLTPKPDAPGVSATTSSTLKVTQTFGYQASVNDISVDAQGKVLGVALSEAKGERTREVYEREKRGELEPERTGDCGARVDASNGYLIERLYGHRGVVATAGISPDGKTLATGGWDKKVLLHLKPENDEQKYGWAVRRVRFSRDGRWLVVAAWTPQNPLGDNQSDPSCTVSEVHYAAPDVRP